MALPDNKLASTAQLVKQQPVAAAPHLTKGQKARAAALPVPTKGERERGVVAPPAQTIISNLTGSTTLPAPHTNPAESAPAGPSSSMQISSFGDTAARDDTRAVTGGSSLTGQPMTNGQKARAAGVPVLTNGQKRRLIADFSAVTTQQTQNAGTAAASSSSFTGSGTGTVGTSSDIYASPVSDAPSAAAATPSDDQSSSSLATLKAYLTTPTGLIIAGVILYFAFGKK